jgi:hypothetical protein
VPQRGRKGERDDFLWCPSLWQLLIFLCYKNKYIY